MKLDPCGCCDASVPPLELLNRPGLPALAYRISTHPGFLRRMLARLAAQAISDEPNLGARPLARLTTRATDDPSIALLDAWAVVADVLTFYQERLANEHYLRTATERRSVLELARTVGYELGPGVAASTVLAFTLDDLPAAPPLVIVPKGAKVQSIPGPGQLPQTFETTEEIEARKEWNALRPRQTQPQRLAIHDGRLFRYTLPGEPAPGGTGRRALAVDLLFAVGQGAASALDDAQVTTVQAAPVEAMLIKSATSPLRAGDRLLFVGVRGQALTTLVLPVGAVTADPERDQTQVQFDVPPPEPTPPALVAATTALVFQLAPPPVPPAFTGAHAVAQLAKTALAEPQLLAVLGANAWSLAQFTALLATPRPSAPSEVFAFRERVGFFGHNAPYYRGLPVPPVSSGVPVKRPFPHDWDEGDGLDIWHDSLDRGPADAPLSPDPSLYGLADVYLERVVPGIGQGSWVVFERQRSDGVPGSRNVFQAYRVGAAWESSVVGFGLSTRATALDLLHEDGTALGDGTEKPADWRVRTTTAHVQSERVELAELPVEDVIPLHAAEITLDTVALDLRAGQLVVLKGEQADAVGVVSSELLTLSGIVHHFVEEAGQLVGRSTLHFERGLTHAYVRSSVRINANVAPATHGESVREVLGSGEAALAHQRFVLRKPPLTYVSAATASGTESTLELRVNGVLWDQAASLYDLGARDERYIVRHEEDGTAQLVFGDGERGARLPTGSENVTARYRSGLGLEGNLDAGRLTLLLTRPAGVREVTNPLAASGGGAPESLTDARANAPLSVTTLGRIVSLPDYEDFARAFAGIGKAQALPLWDGERRLVSITIAAANGDPVDPQSALYRNLVQAIDAARDPAPPVVVGSYVRRSFSLAAKVLIDPRHLAADVFTAAEGALRTAFAFSRRTFGQAVTAGEVIAAIQETPGVVAVDLDRLYRDLVDAPAKASRLPAATARWSGPAGAVPLTILPAELLLINPSGIMLVEMTA